MNDPKPPASQNAEDSDPANAHPGRDSPRITRPLHTGPPGRLNWRATPSQATRWLARDWRKPKFWGIAGALVLCLFVLVFLTRPASPPAPIQTAPDTKVFLISSQPTLTFAHSIGSVQIRSGADGQISIKEDRNGYTDAIQTRYTQNGDSIHITADIESDLSSDTWVDFAVSVPKQASLSVALPDGGTLEADALSGPITLSNTNGSIWANNDTGPLTTRTQSGSITVRHCRGPMRLTTENGTITTSDAQLSGHSAIQAQTGTINFHGSMERSASALFTNSNGEVSLSLPGASAFHAQIRTAGGAVNTNFPGVTIHPRQGGIEADGEVGKPPRAQLTIQTTSGPVLLSHV